MLTNIEGDPLTYQKISVSELNTLLRCTKKHDYAYRQGLSAVDVPTYLSKGSLLHSLMDRYQNHRFWEDDESTFDTDEVSKLVQGELLEERGSTVLEPDRVEVVRVFEMWREEVNRTGDEWKAELWDGEPFIEREFYADLGWQSLDGEPVLLHGVVDLMTREADDSLWLHEHKTAGRAWSSNQLQFAYQGILYAPAVAATTGLKVDGIQYNFFLPKKFDIKQVYTDQTRIDNLLAEVQQAIFLRDTGSIVRQPHWGCNDCWYRNLCFAELIGQDAELIRSTQFTVDPDKVARFTERETQNA